MLGRIVGFLWATSLTTDQPSRVCLPDSLPTQPEDCVSVADDQNVDQNCRFVPTDPTTFLGLKMKFEMTFTLKVGTRLVGTTDPIAFYAFSTLKKPALPATMPSFKNIAAISVSENEPLSVLVNITAKEIETDASLLSKANVYANCLEDSDCDNENTCFTKETFEGKYKAVAFLGNVNVTGSGEEPPTYLKTVCPSHFDTDLLANVESQTVEVDSCYAPSRSVTQCKKLKRCSGSQFQTNFGLTKTEQIECETLTKCGPSNTAFQVVPQTATTDRLCAERVERCSLMSGKITHNNLTCVTVNPCDPETDYTAEGATGISQPVCINLGGPCITATDPDNGQYQSQPRTLQSDKVCADVQKECHTVPPVLKAVRDGLDDKGSIFPVDFFEGFAPTSTSDRVCSAATVCTKGQTLKTGLTPKGDRECSPLPSRAPDSPAAPAPPPVITPDGTAALVWGAVTFVVGAISWVNIAFFGT